MQNFCLVAWLSPLLHATVYSKHIAHHSLVNSSWGAVYNPIRGICHHFEVSVTVKLLHDNKKKKLHFPDFSLLLSVKQDSIAERA